MLVRLKRATINPLDALLGEEEEEEGGAGRSVGD